MKTLLLILVLFSPVFCFSQGTSSTKTTDTISKEQGTIGLLGGAWIPMGQLNAVGIHPEIGFQSLGTGKKKKFYIGWEFFIKFNKSAHAFNFIDSAGKREETNHFFGGYFGIPAAYSIYKSPKQEILFVGGFGGDFFEITAKPRSETEYSINVNTGIEYKIRFGKSAYCGIQLKYNYTNYTSSYFAGSPLTVRIVIGGFGDQIFIPFPRF